MKKMENKCLYCYKTLLGEGDFHEKCSREFFGTSIPPKILYSLDQMNELAKDVVERSVSVPGVQAKLSMSLIKESREHSDSRLTVVGALGGNFIFKPPVEKYPEMPQNEHLTMQIAAAYNLQVVPSSLIRLASGELSYITKRIDRTENSEKIHMLDMFQITEAFDKYRSSMEKVGKALNSYSQNPLLDKIFFFELSLFCFLTGNNDMHLKNFSMIQSNAGWKLAPAYDLLNVSVLLPEDSEELALSLEGKKRKLRKEDFVRFGKRLELTDKQIDSVFKRMIKYKPSALRWIGMSFLSDEMKKAYYDLIDARYSKLELI
jgi:serine/threonine-protein kinase HipA